MRESDCYQRARRGRCTGKSPRRQRADRRRAGASTRRGGAAKCWDLAATEPSAGNPDPDWTVGLRLDLHPATGVFYITDIVRVRHAAGTIEQLVADTAHNDGRAVAVVIEEEGGASGKAVNERYHSHILRGYDSSSDRPSGAKDVRARPIAAAAENGLLRIRPTTAFLDELTAFPHGKHDDCVDAHNHHSNLSASSGWLPGSLDGLLKERVFISPSMKF